MKETVLGRYDRIDKVTQKVANRNEIGYLLVGDNIPDDFEIDLTGDCLFNELEITKREKVRDITSLDEVLKFVEENNIKLPMKLKNMLAVGGGRDGIVLPSLEFVWKEE